jgi:hypothetical protein
MFSAEMMDMMTKEQRRRMSMLGVQARELKRLRDDPPPYPPIPDGLQLAAMFLGFRVPEPTATNILLFDAGYKNRYEWALNNNKKSGLIGWHDAVRAGASRIRPIIASYS